MAGIRQFLKHQSTPVGDEIVCRKKQRNEMSLTSAMSCHDIADTAGNSEELILTDISSFKTDLPKQPKLTSYPKSRMGGVGDNSRARCFQFAWFQNIHGWNIHKQKMRLFVLLAVILRQLVRGKNLYLQPLAFEGGRKLKIPIPGLKNTLNRKLIILL